MKMIGPACRQAGFTLIELLVSVTIVVMLAGGSLAAYSRINSIQGLEKKKEEVISALKLAQSYAKTRQLPPGSVETSLRYVQVQISNGNLVAGANGVGSTYFTSKVNEGSEILVTLNPATLYFWNGNGKMSRDISGNMYAVGDTAGVTIQMESDLNSSRQIIINALGQID